MYKFQLPRTFRIYLPILGILLFSLLLIPNNASADNCDDAPHTQYNYDYLSNPYSFLIYNQNYFNCPFSADIDTSYQYAGQTLYFGNGFISSIGFVLNDSPSGSTNPVHIILVKTDNISDVLISKSFSYTTFANTGGKANPTLASISFDPFFVSSGQYIIGVQSPDVHSDFQAYGQELVDNVIGNCVTITSDSTGKPTSISYYRTTQKCPNIENGHPIYDLSFTVSGTSLSENGWYSGVRTFPLVTCSPTDFVCIIQEWFFSQVPELITNWFTPTQSNITFAQQILGWDTLSKKPPFGYLTAAVAFWNAITIGTPTISVPSFGALEPGIFNPLRTGMRVLLWSLFGIFLLKRASSRVHFSA